MENIKLSCMKNERGVGKRQPDLHEKLIFNTESLRIEKETKPDLHNGKSNEIFEWISLLFSIMTRFL